MKTLAIVETVEQADAALFAYPNAVIVALSAGADAWRAQKGRTDPTIEDLCDERSLSNIASDLTDLIEALSARCAVLAMPCMGLLDSHGDLSLRGFFHYLRTNIDGIITRLEQILAAIESVLPDQLIVFEGEPWRMRGLTCVDKPIFGLTQNLLPRIALAKGIDLVRVSEPVKSQNEISPPMNNEPANLMPPVDTGNVTWLSKKKLQVENPTSADIGRRLMAILDLFRRDDDRESISSKSILLTSLSSDLGSAVQDLWIAQGGKVFGIGSISSADPGIDAVNDIRTRCLNLWQGIRDDSQIEQILTYKGIDIRSEMFPLIELIVCERFPELWAAAFRFDRWFPGQQAIVLMGGIVDVHYVLARSAARHGVPVISCHYGGFIGYSRLPIHERYDLAECDYYLCGGPLAQDTLSERNPEARWRDEVRRAVPIPLGVPGFAELVQSARRCHPRPRPIKRIMVVLNALLGDCRYLGYVFPPEIEYARFTRRLIERLAVEPIELIVKPPLQDRYQQQRNPVEDWLEDQNFPNVSFLRKRPLANCLDSADAFILESPSTPLLQIVATRAPLALYVNQDVYRLVPAARSLLARRCGVFAETEKDFFRGLEKWLADIRSKKLLSGMNMDDSFLQAVCAEQNPNIANKRIVAFLNEICGGRSQGSISPKSSHLVSSPS